MQTGPCLPCHASAYGLRGALLWGYRAWRVWGPRCVLWAPVTPSLPPVPSPCFVALLVESPHPVFVPPENKRYCDRAVWGGLRAHEGSQPGGQVHAGSLMGRRGRPWRTGWTVDLGRPWGRRADWEREEAAMLTPGQGLLLVARPTRPPAVAGVCAVFTSEL